MSTTENKTTEKKVKIRLPVTRDQNDDVFVSVNERTWLIKRGVEVEVPECVVEVLNRSEAKRMQAYERQAALQSK